MMAMKDYYNSLGELGECRIDREARNFKGLAEDSFVGNLKVIEGAKVFIMTGLILTRCVLMMLHLTMQVLGC